MEVEMRVSGVWKRSLVLLFVAGITVLGSRAQITLPVIVQDRSGQGLHDLQNTDFSVQCSNKFSLVSAQEIPPATANQFKNPVPIYVLYDILAIPSPQQGHMSQLMLKYLRAAASENRAVTILVLSDGGLQVIHDMTTDVVILKAALDRLDSKQSADAGVQENKVKDETERLRQLTRFSSPAHFKAYTPVALQQLQTLAQIGDMMRRSPKRKLLVWVTGSFPITVDQLISQSYLVGPNNAEILAQYQRAIDSLNTSHVSVYPTRTFRSSPDVDQSDYALTDFAQATAGHYFGQVDDREFLNRLDDLTQVPQSYYALTLNGSVNKLSRISCKVSVKVSDSRVLASKDVLVKP
jgi:VWFA-related protein